MNVVYPTWLAFVLTLVNVAIATVQIQTGVHLDANQTLAINVVAAVVTAALAFQKSATSAVRQLRGQPAAAPTARAARAARKK